MSINSPVAGDTKVVKQFGYTVRHSSGPYYPIVDSLPGWTGEAVSRSKAPNASTSDFYLPVTNVGAIVGLYDGNPTTYTSLTHALYGAGGVLRVMEKGQLITGTYSYTNDDKLTIRISGGQVFYQKNGTTFYTSLVAPAGVGRNVVAFLYAGGDAVWNLAITSLATGPQSGTASVLLAPLYAVGGKKLVTSSTSFLPLTVTGGKLLAPVFNNAMAQLYPLIGNGSALGPRSNISSTLLAPLFSTGSDVPYGYSSTNLAPLRVSAATLSNIYPGFTGPQVFHASDSYIGSATNNVAISDTAVGTDSAVGAILVAGAYSDTATATDLASAFIGARGAYVDTAVATDQATCLVGSFGFIVDKAVATDAVTSASTLNGLTLSIAVATDRVTGLPGIYDSSRTWVMNEVDDPQNNPSGYASTRYESFDFTSFACFNGQYYGIRADGIYLLDGDDDVGEPITASIDYGLVKMSKDSAFVRVPAAYVGLESTGRMLMRVTFEDDTYTYQSRNDRSLMKMQRFDFGKGLKANFVGIELLNEQGADFDINTVEVAAVPLTRRI